MRFFVLLLFAALVQAEPFVLIKGDTHRGQRFDDFEMAVRPVTNAEYREFVAATKHAAPLHWVNGAIPAGFEAHPVIYVNRHDAAEYLAWRTKKEGRICRLPTGLEFDYVARAGGEPAGAVSNHDTKGERAFPDWRKYLLPAQSYGPNKLGLYGMAGNVWQMVDSYPDPAVQRYKYRIIADEELENGVMGGSWARSAAYVKPGTRGGAGSGMRNPDLGFRLVREPAGATHFRRLPRRVAAVANGNAGALISWQLLKGESGGFHVYRTSRRDAAGERLTQTPVTTSTNFLDAAPPAARVWYRVRGIADDGREGPPSEWAAFDKTTAKPGLLAVFEPTVKQGGFVPVFGDLDGDGVLDLVLKLDNGIKEMSRDPGVPVELEAMTSYGKQLWRRPLVWHDHSFGNANNVPVVVWDMDGDGKAEVLACIQEGDKLYLAILDGMTGRTRRKTPWTPMATDFAKTSTRVHMAVAYLDGKHPAIITQTGLYENEIIEAWDARLTRLWRYDSNGATSGSGSHHIDIADVDGDGRDEVFNGTMVLNPDGKLRWALYRQHPDIVAIKQILPDRKGRQVYYAVESGTHAGAYVIDAATGKQIWKLNREDDPRWVHAHIGWAADLWDGSPGLELLTNRDGHTAKETVLFAADGRILAEPFPGGWWPVNWTGAATRELLAGNGQSLARFDGKAVTPLNAAAPAPGLTGGSCRFVADLAGDFRDEIVCTGRTETGPAIFVYSNPAPLERREVARTASREYRLWLARNLGGGYGAYFEWQPSLP